MSEEEVKVEIGNEIPEKELLIDRDKYLAAGVHIGTKLKTKHTLKWIYRTTSYGLYVININLTDDRIRIAAKFFSRFPPEKILVCSVRRYGGQPVRKFCEIVKAIPIDRRFIPGTLTNPMVSSFMEPKVILIIDPHADKQVLKEAKAARIPVVSLIDTDDMVDGIDLVIPTNNRGRKALSLIMYLLARQILREKGDILPNEDLKVDISEFESKIVAK